MNKQEAKLADIILNHFANNQSANISVRELNHLFAITPENAQRFINLFLSDVYIEPLRHPGIPEHDFGVYFITNKGVKFIAFDEGYRKKRRYDRYKHQNIQFTWIRHWAWFFAFVLSFFLNLYLLFFKALV